MQPLIVDLHLLPRFFHIFEVYFHHSIWLNRFHLLSWFLHLLFFVWNCNYAFQVLARLIFFIAPKRFHYLLILCRSSYQNWFWSLRPVLNKQMCCFMHHHNIHVTYIHNVFPPTIPWRALVLNVLHQTYIKKQWHQNPEVRLYDRDRSASTWFAVHAEFQVLLLLLASDGCFLLEGSSFFD